MWQVVSYHRGMKSLREQLLKAMESSGKPHSQVSRETGIAQSILSRLRSGERNVSVETAERLADYLKCEIVLRPKGPRGKGKK